MSKQLAISSAFSIFAMAAFVLFTTNGNDNLHSTAGIENVAGASIEIEAPTSFPQWPTMPALPFISD